MLTTLNFLVSPLGVICLIALLFVLPMWYKCQQQRRSFEKLQRHFNATYSCFSSAVTFTRRGFAFRYGIQGSGAISYTSVIQTPVLWAPVRATSGFFVANGEITKFQFDWNLQSKDYRKHLSLGGMDLLIGSEDEQLLLRIEQVLVSHSEITQKLAQCFTEKSSFLRVSTETHIGAKSPVSRPYVMRYFGFTKVYIEPVVLEKTIDDILSLVEKLDIVPE